MVIAFMPFLDRLIWWLAALILAGALSGCSTMELGDSVWYKPGGTIEERDRLLAAAQVQTAQAHATPTPGAPDQASAKRQTERDFVLTTMTAAGWRLVPKSEAGPLKHETKTGNKPRSLTTAMDR
jgi:hypothetical protein